MTLGLLKRSFNCESCQNLVVQRVLCCRTIEKTGTIERLCGIQMNLPSHSVKLISILVVVLALVTNRAVAQDAPGGIPIQFAGRIEAISGPIITVNQLSIDVRAAQVNAPLQAGSQIVVRGLLLDSGLIEAQSISFYIPPTATPAAVEPTIQATQETLPFTLVSTIAPTTPAALPTPSIFSVEGSVQAVERDYVLVNNIRLQFERHDALLDELRVGDVVRIEGNLSQAGNGMVFMVTRVTVLSRAGVTESEDEDRGNSGMGMGNND